jgi:predicted DCC family thiol-disulfide oxidoreductase YuxK
MSETAITTNSENTVTKPVVVFDGDCRFCRARIAEFQKLDQNNAMEFMPRQEPSCEERLPSVRGIDLEDGILFVEPNGKVHVAADAIYQMYSVCPATKNYVWLYHIPVLKQAIQLGYRLIAMNRRRLGQTCENNICSIDKH